MDTQSKSIYSVQMILESLKGTGLEMDFLKIPIFDALIGNSDRHHSNWAVVKNNQTGTARISPLYDNGSSLCCLIRDDKVQHYLSSSINFESLIYGKSKSIIGWENVKKPRHMEMVNYLSNKYYEETINMIKCIEKAINEDTIRYILNLYDDCI